VLGLEHARETSSCSMALNTPPAGRATTLPGRKSGQGSMPFQATTAMDRCWRPLPKRSSVRPRRRSTWRYPDAHRDRRRRCTRTLSLSRDLNPAHDTEYIVRRRLAAADELHLGRDSGVGGPATCTHCGQRGTSMGESSSAGAAMYEHTASRSRSTGPSTSGKACTWPSREEYAQQTHQP
jgi:hypothetical protein